MSAITSIFKFEHLITEPLSKLRTAFQARGLDIRLVGGCVRDTLQGVPSHDIDLCTDATPDEQIAIYEAEGYQYIPTGLQHGTITVILDSVGYEITTLRTEDEHDGRHAKMTFTRDWQEDLSRRDLTINAMSLTFDGELFDPFDGATDLLRGVVRFVGDPQERIQEDYLRILRYFRFLGRVLPHGLLNEDYETLPGYQAIVDNMHGLSRISVERIWTETSKILAHPSAYWVYPLMLHMGISEPARLPASTVFGLHRFKLLTSRIHDGYELRPALLVACFIDTPEQAEAVGRELKWSTTERLAIKHVKSYKGVAHKEALEYQAYVKNVPLEYVQAAAKFHTVNVFADLTRAKLPVFPVTGAHLQANGFTPGPKMGKVLAELKDQWFYSSFTLNTADLLQIAKGL